MHRWLGIAGLFSAAALFVSGCGLFAGARLDPPTDEAAFLSLKAGLEEAYDEAPDDVVKAKLAAQWRDRDLCSILRAPDFMNWVGRVDGDPQGGTVVIDLGNKVRLTAEAATSSSVAKALPGLEDGDDVRISGAFVSDDPQCAAQIVAAPWDEKAIREPNLKARLTDIRVL